MSTIFSKKGLTPKSENFSAWYTDLVTRADLADYSSVKGCMIIKPTGMALWEKTQAVLDSWFKEDGVKNVYFPLFIPHSLLQKEKDHLKGFSPELAIVGSAGNEKLAEPLVVRPTSETIMYQTFSDWIHSYRDLPFKINQWCNIVRWEKRTYPFLRTTEFLWQEGHTVHQTESEAQEMVLKALEWYRRFYEEYFAIDPYIGLKSENEKFAGAKATYGVEAVTFDGKSLQSATSHNLGDNFSRVFDITIQDEKGENKYPFQTSWGLSTRAIGALIMTHGDDSGMILPPKVASPQVVILPIKLADDVVAKSEEIQIKLKEANISSIIDRDESHALGFRINEWEIKGVPLRIEIGPKELESDQVTMVRRDTFKKDQIAVEGLVDSVSKKLDDIQENLLQKARQLKKDMTVEVDDFVEFKRIMIEDRKFIRAFWCENPKCEDQIKADTKACTRVLELGQIDKTAEGHCIGCRSKATRKWLFAQSY